MRIINSRIQKLFKFLFFSFLSNFYILDEKNTEYFSFQVMNLCFYGVCYTSSV